MFFDCVLVSGAGYRLNPALTIDFDMDSFLLNLKLGSGDEAGGQPREVRLAQAVETYSGPFLNGFYSEWCEDLRTDLELKYLTALMSLASYRSDKGDFVQAVEMLEKVVQMDPYNEEAYYQLIENYLKCIEPFAALQQLRKYSRITQEELGTNLPKRFLDSYKRIVQLIPNGAAAAD